MCQQIAKEVATTLRYVAHDRGQELADEVGYQIRFVNQFGDHTRLIYATTAIVLRRLHTEADLDSVGCLIIDEACNARPLFGCVCVCESHLCT